MSKSEGLHIVIGKTYGSRFTNKPAMTIKKVFDNGDYVVDVFMRDGSTVERIMEPATVRTLCYREYDPNLRTIPYLGEITKADVECIQKNFRILVTEETVRQAINTYNWGGDHNDNFVKYGLTKDYANREVLNEMVFKLLSEQAQKIISDVKQELKRK